MANYRVEIPEHSTSRMKKHSLVIEYGDSWNGAKRDVIPLTEDISSYKFEMHDSYALVGETSVIDGPEFMVFVEYRNSTGSRKDSKILVPVKED